MIRNFIIILIIVLLSFSQGLAEKNKFETKEELTKYAKLLGNEKNWDEFIKLYEDAIKHPELYPKDLILSSINRNIAIGYYRKKNLKKAIEYGEKSIKKRAALNYFILSVLYQGDKQLQKAAEASEKSIELLKKPEIIKEYKSSMYDHYLRLNRAMTPYVLWKKELERLQKKYPNDFESLHWLKKENYPNYQPQLAMHLGIIKTPPINPDKTKIYYLMGEVVRKKGALYICKLVVSSKTYYFGFQDKMETVRGKVHMSKLGYNQVFSILGRISSMSDYTTVLGATKVMPVFKAIHMEPATGGIRDYQLYPHI